MATENEVKVAVKAPRWQELMKEHPELTREDAVTLARSEVGLSQEALSRLEAGLIKARSNKEQITIERAKEELAELAKVADKEAKKAKNIQLKKDRTIEHMIAKAIEEKKEEAIEEKKEEAIVKKEKKKKKTAKELKREMAERASTK
jgi:hypothetical protein